MASKSHLLVFLFFLFRLTVSFRASPILDANSPALLQPAINISKCRTFPGDQNWPTESEWSTFNKSVGGRLVATVPIASACHNDIFEAYSEEQCNELQSVWLYPWTHDESSSSVMAPYYANDSCNPFAPRNARCGYGTYIRYAVNASNVDDYRKTMTFAGSKNIRLVIRNTGHDYYGKSTGAGALGLWTHHLKNMSFIDYKSPYYNGKAAKLGAGVQVFEVNEAAHAHNLTVVAGDCTTVGVVGGYTQGGGHGPLASKWGLAADSVLEWEVVTAQGQHLVATPNNNSDLYWALSGGGGGTYAAVLSMTTRAHPDLSTATANLTFSRENVSDDAFYGAVQAWIMNLPSLIDSGAGVVWWLTNESLSVQPATAPGMSSQQMTAVLAPTLTSLKKSGITYQYFVAEFPSYLASFHEMNPVLNITNNQVGGRLIPRSLAQTNSSSYALMDAMRYISQQGILVSGISVDASKRSGHIDNAVNPAWRDAMVDCVFGPTFDYHNWTLNVENRNKITDDWLPRLEKLTPGGGAYLNEGDPQQVDWQHVFYGSNYQKLTAIKEKYDPHGLFYGLTAVGSERWTEQADGRLCRSA